MDRRVKDKRLAVWMNGELLGWWSLTQKGVHEFRNLRVKLIRAMSSSTSSKIYCRIISISGDVFSIVSENPVHGPLNCLRKLPVCRTCPGVEMTSSESR